MRCNNSVRSAMLHLRPQLHVARSQTLLPLRASGSRDAQIRSFDSEEAYLRSGRLLAAAAAALTLTCTAPTSWAVTAPEAAGRCSQEVAQVAGFLGLSSSEKEERTDPFTLQGTTEKQYRIEELEGTKVVRRRPGVSVKTCIKIASTAQSGGSGSLEAPEESVCRSARDRSSVKRACLASCTAACSDGLEQYRTQAAAELGLPPSKADLERPGRRCARSCAAECRKEGSGYRFTVNYGG